MWASDFLHPDDIWLTLSVHRQGLGQLPSTRHKIICENAGKLYGE
jgi:hypothetical protein